jgi:hypothetical protein
MDGLAGFASGRVRLSLANFNNLSVYRLLQFYDEDLLFSIPPPARVRVSQSVAGRSGGHRHVVAPYAINGWLIMDVQ